MGPKAAVELERLRREGANGCEVSGSAAVSTRAALTWLSTRHDPHPPGVIRPEPPASGATPAQVKAAVTMMVGARASRMLHDTADPSTQAMMLAAHAHDWLESVGVDASQLDGAVIDGAAFAACGVDAYDSEVVAKYASLNSRPTETTDTLNDIGLALTGGLSDEAAIHVLVEAMEKHPPPSRPTFEGNDIGVIALSTAHEEEQSLIREGKDTSTFVLTGETAANAVEEVLDRGYEPLAVFSIDGGTDAVILATVLANLTAVVNVHGLAWGPASPPRVGATPAGGVA